MAITKTNFINYTRCPRYVSLESIKKEKLDSEVVFEDYINEENNEKIKDMLGLMYETKDDGAEVDLIDQKNNALEQMLKYYKQVEVEASKVVEKKFNGKTTYSLDTRKQESFDFNRNGIRYLCYLDIYNESNDDINVIECKATTSRKMVDLKGGYPKGKKYSIFTKKNGIYYFKDDIDYDYSKEMDDKTYYALKDKLMNRYKDGKYLYDLTVQRFIIEGEYEETKQLNKINKTKYYLAVLNHEYIFDGTYQDDEPVYNNINGEEIIALFDMTKFTENMLQMVKNDASNLELILKKMSADKCLIGDYCQMKCPTECKYFKKICGSFIPPKNSILAYLNCRGFKDEHNNTYSKIDLLNDGYVDMLDIPDNWIKNPNHFIQRNAYQNNEPYINKEKIKAAISNLKYPIYHLDFESFPCPLPRFKGEKPYTQSVFEFSLHIEKEPGKCDFNNDHYTYLATSNNDEREELVKALIKHIDNYDGLLFAQNISFEKTRIKELADIFPEYKEKLLKINDMAYDLLYIIENNQKLYEMLGFDEENIKTVNYYHPYQSGSYSIKKTLPVLSNLSYDKLDVKNGTEAYITYLSYPLYTKEQYKLKYNALITYCKQDTWAMVLILDALRNIVK